MIKAKIIITVLVILLIALVMSSIVFISTNQVAIVHHTMIDSVYVKNHTFFHNIIDENVYKYPIEETINYKPFPVTTCEGENYIVTVIPTVKLTDPLTLFYNTIHKTHKDVIEGTLQDLIKETTQDTFNGYFKYEISKDSSSFTSLVKRNIEEELFELGYDTKNIKIYYTYCK